jgi:hypothetical protein
VTKAYSDAVASYEAEITKAPEYSSAVQILAAYQLTGKDVPAAVTATDDYVEYTTTPDWYATLPSSSWTTSWPVYERLN